MLLFVLVLDIGVDFWTMGMSGLIYLALYGQEARQYLHPMQRCSSMTTMPSSRLQVAWTGQLMTQGGRSHWLQREGRKWRVISTGVTQLSRISSFARCKSLELNGPGTPLPALLTTSPISRKPGHPRRLNTSAPRHTHENVSPGGE